MIHISGFLKVVPRDGGILQSNVSANNKNFVVMPSDISKNFQVLGLVAECHLIESPVIMELTIQHSTFSGTATLDMKFTSVDVRWAIFGITCRGSYMVISKVFRN